MQTINLDPDKALIAFKQARRLAAIQAAEKLTRHLITAWKDNRNHLTEPGIPGHKRGPLA